VVGSSSAVEGVVESLRLGRARVENVSTYFSLAKEGMLASEEFAGNIGNDVLRRFKVVFDYSRRLMILESNRPHASGRHPQNRAGVNTDARSPRAGIRGRGSLDLRPRPAGREAARHTSTAPAPAPARR
jgi:hypothetical protein